MGAKLREHEREKEADVCIGRTESADVKSFTNIPSVKDFTLVCLSCFN